MGSYAHLEIQGHPFFPMKSYVDNTLMTIFEECDRQIFVRRMSERNEAIWGTPDDEEDEEDEEETIYEYRLESTQAKQRLELQGFTLRRAKAAFEQSIALYAAKLAEGGIILAVWWQEGEEAADFLRKYTFDVWLDEIREFLDLGGQSFFGRNELEILPPYQRIIANYDVEEFLWGFPLCDPRLIVRALLEALPASASVILDYTDLVNGGYYEGEEELAAGSRESASAEFVVCSKIVILTEGSTDARYLSESLKILHPHLFPLFSFIDFHEPKLAGGASSLVHVLKGFIGAQIANRVIALFDNDTAAEVALRALNSIKFPSRFRVLRYPPLPLGESYRTIGPQGESLMNVNGLAGSIEFYFGEEILRGEDGKFTPVQWKGYDQTVQKYQGELIGKSTLQEKFEAKIDAAKCGASPALSGGDWSGMPSIWETIFAACNDESPASKTPDGW